MKRREFIAAVSTAMATIGTATAQPGTEKEPFVVEVPPGATLWGHVYFLADEPVEVTMSIGPSVQTMRGAFSGKREAEYRWRNGSQRDARVSILARLAGSDRVLPFGPVDYTKGQRCYVGFGRRGTPDQASAKRGGYPSHAAFVGFTVFEPA